MADSGSSDNASSTSISAKELMLASVNQSAAVAVQDATDLLRNISTIETTVIGIASAKWLADPANPSYEKIIKNATDTISSAVENLAKVGENTAKVISDLSK